jgi:hypothetical protein
MQEKRKLSELINFFFITPKSSDSIKNLRFLLESVDNTEFIINPQKENTVELINCEDIIYITLDHSIKKREIITIVTETGEHSYHNPETDIFEFLSKNSNCFRMVNSDLMVNFNKIYAYDSDMRLLYFTKESKESSVLACTAAIKHCVKTIVGVDKDRKLKLPRRAYTNTNRAQ